jgi:hypothetical protein
MFDRGSGWYSRGFCVGQWRYCEEREHFRQDMNELKVVLAVCDFGKFRRGG